MPLIVPNSMTLEQKAAYLRTLPAIRERCGRVFELAKEGKLQYFDYHPEKEGDVTEFCLGIMTRDFGTNFTQIPPHGRWRHFDLGRPRVEPLLSKWQSQSLSDSKESSKRLIDLFIVSVLLDAGAGKDWSYTEKETGGKYSRSEGLAIASIHMFEDGLFSSDKSQPHKADAAALSKITVESIASHMQVSESNPLVGLEGRTSLLKNLSNALLASPKLFGEEGRPGNMLDFLESESKASPDGNTRQVPLAALWHVLIEGLNPVWPATRTKLAGVSLGDVWPCQVLKETAQEEGDDLVPFHKLTQWMTYSVVEAIKQTMKWDIVGMEDMTGLPEYRNGGLLLDIGVLTLKPDVLPIDPISGLPKAASDHPAIVEWRALTVIMLDRITSSIRAKLGLSPEQLNLAQVLESATWKGGREIAKSKRPRTGGPPMELESDGTVF
ncbi:DUF1688-domain-containing protein [Dendrothele bispora CBS 962.96]|uniref:DUF1688-domain-containing protein n=1 Tax=Dendrothele bispora (strain CBS 962.96) TaxID=1314807 RepID=A0A4S8M811_DENBC|nr:DUF1688-domain-containing protein [Dendrothele bispora CBS 962.96]